MPTMSNDVGLILNDPLDNLSFLDLHGLSHSGWEVDVVLIGCLLPLDELDLCWVSHDAPPMS